VGVLEPCALAPPLGSSSDGDLASESERIFVDQIGAAPAQPDSIVDATALLGRHGRIEPWPPWRRGGDVGRRTFAICHTKPGAGE